MSSDGIGGKQNSRHLRQDHLLNNHRQIDCTVVEAVLKAVRHRPVGKERRPALADMLEDRLLSDDVQIRILLACKGGRREILCGCARSHRIGVFLSKPGEDAGDRFLNVFGDGYAFDDPANLSAQLTDCMPVFHLETRELVK